MKILCKVRTGESLPSSYFETGLEPSRHPFPLTIGKEYVVYALAVKERQIWYYISDDDELFYPVRYPAPLFDVVDQLLSKHWGYAFTPEHLDHFALFSFDEWISDPYFYDRLTDGNELDVLSFKTMKAMMDKEATAVSVE